MKVVARSRHEIISDEILVSLECPGTISSTIHLTEARAVVSTAVCLNRLLLFFLSESTEKPRYTNLIIIIIIIFKRVNLDGKAK
jgi:hypothetical protein